MPKVKPGSRSPCRTRDHTEVALRAFGVELNRKAAGAGSEVRIRGGQRLRGLDARIPGDLSSAAFFLCAAALFPGSQLTIPHLLMNPTAPGCWISLCRSACTSP